MHADNDLERFVDAQDGVYDNVRRELQAGRKATHWMWFVFPQLRGLGHSETARHYGLASGAEARAYLDHPVLGARLRECVELVLRIDGRNAREIFGAPDDVKFRSSMTLFAGVAPDDALFERALARYFGGETDPVTTARLAAEQRRR